MSLFLKKIYLSLRKRFTNVCSKTIAILYQKRKSKGKRIYLIGTEDYGNLGDHHIAVSEINMLKKVCDDIIEIPASRYDSVRDSLIWRITKSDTIALTGGGNFGDAYPVATRIRRDIIKLFPKNKKIIFPQTVFYENNNENDLAIDKKLFTKKNNVILFTREKVSYSIAKNEFDCEVFLAPDIVLSSKYNAATERKNQISFCFRSDKETYLRESDRNNIIEVCSHLFSEIKTIDTQLPYDVNIENRNSALTDFLDIIMESSLVITDRLHGMVFCAITGTPCIAIRNYNQKVTGTYEWIKELPYIKCADSTKEIIDYVNSSFYEGIFEYSESILEKNFLQLKNTFL